MNVKDIIRQKRLECGYTMKELAEKVGVSAATVSRWESGDLKTMKHTKFMLLANALQTSPAILLDSSASSSLSISPQEEKLIKKYRQLDADGKRTIDEQVDFQIFKQQNAAKEEEEGD